MIACGDCKNWLRFECADLPQYVGKKWEISCQNYVKLNDNFEKFIKKMKNERIK